MIQFATCPIHDEPTDYVTNADPSPDWKEHMERLVQSRERADELSAAIPLARGVTARIDDNNLIWVDQGDLGRAGVRLSRMVPDQFHLFELEDGWVYETQGWDMPRRRWWVERVIRSEGAASPLTTSADGPSSTESATS
jgi:hypothetical protein